MSISISGEYISDVVNCVAGKLNLTKFNHVVETFDSMGQNYFGVIVPVTFVGYKDNNQEEIIHMVLKCAPTDARYRVSGAVGVMFRREIYIYSVYLKKIRGIQREICQYKADAQYIIPDVYFTRDECEREVIAMRNMNSDGYKAFDTFRTFLDFDHVVVSLKALARLHAFSYIVKIKHNKFYEEVCNNCPPLTENTNQRYMDILRNRLDKAIHNFQNTNYVAFLTKMRINCADIFDRTIERTTTNCISHGDIWKENILFKYENGKPISACLIDYQTTRVVCPAYDVLYLIVSSTDAELRQQHYYQLLDIYYDCLDQMLRNGGLTANEIYERQSFNDDLKVVAPACFVTANCALWLANGLQEEGHVKSKIVFRTHQEKQEALNIYKSIVGNIIEDFYKYEYLP